MLGRPGGVVRGENFLEPLGGFVTDEVELKRPSLVLPHVLLAIVLAEDVEMLFGEPDAVLSLSG